MRDLVAIACCSADVLRDCRNWPGSFRNLRSVGSSSEFQSTLTQSGVPQSAIPRTDTPDGLETAAARDREFGAPLVAHWAVTYRCNLACSFCYSESSPNCQREPASELRSRIVQRLAVWGILEVALGGGEPTILSDFPQLLAAIRRHGMVPNVTTNGILNSAKILHALADHAGTVHLSADRSDLLDAARGGGVSARIKETAQRLSTLHVRWGVNLLLTPHNAESLHRSLVELQDLGATAITLLRPKGRGPPGIGPAFPHRADLRSTAASVKRFMKRNLRYDCTSIRLYVANGPKQDCWMIRSRMCSVAVAANTTWRSLPPATSIPVRMLAGTICTWAIYCETSWTKYGGQVKAKWRGGGMGNCVAARHVLATTKWGIANRSEDKITRKFDFPLPCPPDRIAGQRDLNQWRRRESNPRPEIAPRPLLRV